MKFHNKTFRSPYPIWQILRKDILNEKMKDCLLVTNFIKNTVDKLLSRKTRIAFDKAIHYLSCSSPPKDDQLLMVVAGNINCENQIKLLVDMLSTYVNLSSGSDVKCVTSVSISSDIPENLVSIFGCTTSSDLSTKLKDTKLLIVYNFGRFNRPELGDFSGQISLAKNPGHYYVIEEDQMLFGGISTIMINDFYHNTNLLSYGDTTTSWYKALLQQSPRQEDLIGFRILESINVFHDMSPESFFNQSQLARLKHFCEVVIRDEVYTEYKQALRSVDWTIADFLHFANEDNGFYHYRPGKVRAIRDQPTTGKKQVSVVNTDCYLDTLHNFKMAVVQKIIRLSLDNKVKNEPISFKALADSYTNGWDEDSDKDGSSDDEE